MRRLILVRHAETVENVNDICCGHDPGHLTPKGKRQAALVAKRLKDEHLDVIYAADLKRVIDTAKAIRKYHPRIPLELKPQLREQGLGIFEGAKGGSVHNAAEKAGIPFISFRPENGESYLDMKRRVITWYQELERKEKGKDVLVVTSGGPIVALLMHIDHAPEDRWREYVVSNASVSMVVFPKQGGKGRIVQKNSVEHLS